MRVTLALLVLLLLLPHLVTTHTEASPFARSQRSTEAVPFPVEEASITSLEAAYLARLVPQLMRSFRPISIALRPTTNVGPLINALVTVNPHALRRSRPGRCRAVKAHWQADRATLYGIPVIVKDNIDLTGLPDDVQVSKDWKNYYPSEDAPLGEEESRAAGGIILAKSSLSEFVFGALVDNINSVPVGLCAQSL